MPPTLALLPPTPALQAVRPPVGPPLWFLCAAVVAPRYIPPLSRELTLDRATMRLSLEPFGSTDMDVAIEIFPDRLAACLRHVGPHDHAGPTYECLLRWAATAGLLEPDAVVMGLSYDDPGAVAEDALCYDVCLGLTETRGAARRVSPRKSARRSLCCARAARSV